MVEQSRREAWGGGWSVRRRPGLAVLAVLQGRKAEARTGPTPSDAVTPWPDHVV